MGKGFDYVHRRMVDFKLDRCCWMAPVRVGLLVCGYFNLVLAAISLVGLSDDSFAPILMQVEMAILGDNAKKPIPILAYAAELSFSAILLCALYRKDIPMLRLYQRYCIAAVITSLLVYSMIVAAIGALVGIMLVTSILFQIYVIFLVRSMIVELKLEKRSLELPTLVMSSMIPEPKVVKVEDVEAPSDSDDSDDDKSIDDKKDRLETVNEHPKEEANEHEEKEKK